MVERASRTPRTRGRSPGRARARSRDEDRPSPEEWNEAYRRYVEEIPECAKLYLEKHPTFSLYCKMCDKCFDPSHAECDRHIKNLQYHQLTHAWVVFKGDDWSTGKWILQEWPQRLHDPYAVVGLPSKAAVPQAPWLLPFYNARSGAKDPYDYNPPPPTANYWDCPSMPHVSVGFSFPPLKDGTVDDSPPPSLSNMYHSDLKAPNPFVHTGLHAGRCAQTEHAPFPQPRAAGMPSFLAPYMSAETGPLPPLPTAGDTATAGAPPTLSSVLSAAVNDLGDSAPALPSCAPPLPGCPGFVAPQPSNGRPLPPDVPGRAVVPPLPTQEQQQDAAPPRRASPPPPPVEERIPRRESPPPPPHSRRERREPSARRVSPPPVRDGENRPQAAGLKLECADERFDAVIDTFSPVQDGVYKGETHGATIEKDRDQCQWKLIYREVLVATVSSDPADRAPPIKGWVHQRREAPFVMKRVILR